METKFKKGAYIAVCILFSVLVYLYLCMVVTPKEITDSGGSLYYRGMGFLSEPEQSIDVMIYGNSDVYSGIIPAKLFSEYGYTSYASGRANQTTEEIVGLLNLTLTRQKPKVVLLETDCFFTKQKRVNLDSGNLLFAPFLYHSRWKELEKKDFLEIPDRTGKVDLHKGFLPSRLTRDSSAYGNYMKDEGKAPAHITEKNREEIERFVTICKNEGIPVVFLELPSPSSWNYRKHQAVAALAKQHGVRFLDLNLAQENYRVDLAGDFRDDGNHMNTVGADRATGYIGQYLSEEFSGTFRKNPNRNASEHWKKSVASYQKLVKPNGRELSGRK